MHGHGMRGRNQRVYIPLNSFVQYFMNNSKTNILPCYWLKIIVCMLKVSFMIWRTCIVMTSLWMSKIQIFFKRTHFIKMEVQYKFHDIRESLQEFITSSLTKSDISQNSDLVCRISFCECDENLQQPCHPLCNQEVSWDFQ